MPSKFLAKSPPRPNSEKLAAATTRFWQNIQAEDLRQFVSPEPRQAVQNVEDCVECAGESQGIPSAVLFPIVLHEQGLTVLFTRRTDALRDHAGQICFPGGRVEADDASCVCTALREAEEEISLSTAQVDVLGYLPNYNTVTGYSITPVLGMLRPPLGLIPDPAEVADIFEVPLAFLLDPANHQRQQRDYQGATRAFFAIAYGEHFIWGATAGIIVSLSQAMLSLNVDYPRPERIVDVLESAKQGNKSP